MRITKYLYLIFIIALYAINYYYLNWDVFKFTGLVLLSLVVLVIVINFIVKYRNKKKGITNDDFIFSENVARTMKVIDLGIQYESTMLALSCLMVGLLLFVIYILFFAQYSWIMKGFISFNTVCAFFLMGSMLVTTYQQYVSYKESTKVIGELANQFGTEILSPNKLKSGTILTPLEKEEKVIVVDETKGDTMEKAIDKVFNDKKKNERRLN